MSPNNIKVPCSVKEKQASIIDFILSTNLWCLPDLINRIGFFQGKGIRCLESQLKIANSLDLSRKCINQTVQEMLRAGIIKIKKRKFLGSKWLHNEMILDPIMFTKTVVESLMHFLNYNHYKTYVSIASVTLIQLNMTSLLGFVGNRTKNEEKNCEISEKASKWDQLLKPTAI